MNKNNLMSKVRSYLDIRYNNHMRNWSTDTSKMNKNSLEYQTWKLENQINFGLENGEKLQRSNLSLLLPKINIDEHKRTFLQFILNHAQAN